MTMNPSDAEDEDKLDRLLKLTYQNRQHLKDINGTLKRHDREIGTIDKCIQRNERWINRMKGGIAAIATLMSIFALYIVKMIL